MNRELFNDIVAMLTPDMSTTNGRQALVQQALWGCQILDLIDWAGAPQEFTARLVGVLWHHGECSAGKLALVALLETARNQKGDNRHASYNALIQRIYEATKNQEKGASEMVEPAGFLFLLEIAKWAADELSARWQFKRAQQMQADEIAAQSEDSPVLQDIWKEMTQKHSEQEVKRIFKLIDDNRQLILQYEQSKANARKQSIIDGNTMLLENRLEYFDGQIQVAKTEMNKHAARLGIHVEE